MHDMFDPIINIIGTLCPGISIVFTKMGFFHQMLQWSHINLHFGFKSSLQCNLNVYICHTPILGPTRLADPNRFWGARTYTGTLCLIFFFFKVELVPVGMAHIL